MSLKARHLIYACLLRGDRNVEFARLDVQVGRRFSIDQLLARGVAYILQLVVVYQIAVVFLFILIVLNVDLSI